MQFNIHGEAAFASTGHQPHQTGKPYLVFIHGAGMDHSVWLVYERYFARQGYNVVSLDLPGHGRSHGKPLPSIESLASWLADYLEELNLTGVTLIGHSMGSLVAFECAGQCPDRVAKVILLGFSYPMAVGPPLLEAARNDDQAAIDMMVIYGHDFRAQVGGNRSAGVSVINSAKRLLERNQPGVLYTDLNACNSYQNGTNVAEKLTCPVVFISGDRDKMTPPRAAEKMSKQLVNGSMHRVKNSGHGVMAEQPELTYRLLVRAMAV
ncbi:MAG: pimeloyl-ACP methyl ester carboxylesterase [Gammaproteobacteria bacterium]|jgi:pimeloyl-ACP methyl ester carboxylesterase